MLVLLCACAPRAAVTSAGQRPSFKPLAELRDVPDLGVPSALKWLEGLGQADRKR